MKVFWLYLFNLSLEFKSKLRKYLESRRISDCLGTLLEDVGKRGINIFQAPYMDST